MSISYYRKYRPQASVELDLDVVRAFFGRILSSGSISHAYLFTGPKGAGKTSAARILAKIVNCEENRPSLKATERQASLLEPCNKCEACVSITNGSNMDVMEIDAASNRGIDDIRDLREKVRLSPVALARKVYIIDEVHMLTMEAFNALLKTLEEPPAHVLFVLATTEAHKVPDTIVSRCVRLHFPHATDLEVVRSLEKAVEGEKLNVEDGVLLTIAKVADGSFREAMKVLEQLALFGGGITLERAMKELGQTGLLSPEKLMGFLVTFDQRGAMEELQRLEREGVNWQVLVRDGLEVLREELLRSMGVAGEWLRAGKIGKISMEQLQRLVAMWMRAARDMRDAPITQLPLELLVAEWCAPAKQDNYQSASWRTNNQFSNENLTTKRQIRQLADKLTNTQTEEKRTDKQTNQQRPKVQPKIETPKTDGGLPHKETLQGKPTADKPKIAFGEIEQRWREVLAAVKPHNHSLEGLLRSTKPMEMVGNKLRIEVFYQFHLDQLKQDKFLRVVEGAIEQVFSASVRLEYSLGNRPQHRVAAPVENVTGDVADNDILKAAEEIFGAE